MPAPARQHVGIDDADRRAPQYHRRQLPGDAHRRELRDVLLQPGGGGGGPGGAGAIINASKIILGGWVIEAGGPISELEGPGLYVTTPSGITAKIELIDFRQTQVPETATLRVEPKQESVAENTAITNQYGVVY